MRFRLTFLLCQLGLLVATVVPAQTAETQTDSELRYVVILTRHGVRSPLNSQSTLEKYAAEPWPTWSVPPGHLTEHGRRQMTLMGEYYRERYIRDGLFTGDVSRDKDRIFFRADSDQRTIETARGLAAALLPEAEIAVHARTNEAIDPMFRPVLAPVGHPNVALGIAAVSGRIGGDPAIVQEANRAAFDTLEKILVGESGKIPAGKVAVLAGKSAVGPGIHDHVVGFSGGLQVAESITDVLMLEYAEGMPMEQVGWGRMSEERLTQISVLHSLYFELLMGTYYPAQVQSSDLAAHILATLQQAASGHPDPRAFGTPDQKMTVIVGHDTNIANLGGLLGLNWWVPGASRNPVLPGGALILELRQRRRDGQFFVCASYASQTFGQMRELTKLSLAEPPALSPIFIPECSGSEPGYPAPFAKVTALFQRVIDPEFVVADPN